MTWFFFPVKLEINLDLMIEISTGNTPEISTGFPSKSAIWAIFEAFFSRFWNQNLLPVEISTGPKSLKIEKYGVSGSFCTLNRYYNSKTRKSRAGQSWWIFTKNEPDFGFWKCEFLAPKKSKSTNFDRPEICEFWSYDIDSKCKMKLKHHTFRFSNFWDP